LAEKFQNYPIKSIYCTISVIINYWPQFQHITKPIIDIAKEWIGANICPVFNEKRCKINPARGFRVCKKLACEKYQATLKLKTSDWKL
jgi:hypothetical protein